MIVFFKNYQNAEKKFQQKNLMNLFKKKNDEELEFETADMEENDEQVWIRKDGKLVLVEED